jgi:hypothetical protein
VRDREDEHQQKRRVCPPATANHRWSKSIIAAGVPVSITTGKFKPSVTFALRPQQQKSGQTDQIDAQS